MKINKTTDSEVFSIFAQAELEKGRLFKQANKFDAISDVISGIKSFMDRSKSIDPQAYLHHIEDLLKNSKISITAITDALSKSNPKKEEVEQAIKALSVIDKQSDEAVRIFKDLSTQATDPVAKKAFLDKAEQLILNKKSLKLDDLEAKAKGILDDIDNPSAFTKFKKTILENGQAALSSKILAAGGGTLALMGTGIVVSLKGLALLGTGLGVGGVLYYFYNNSDEYDLLQSLKVELENSIDGSKNLPLGSADTSQDLNQALRAYISKAEEASGAVDGLLKKEQIKTASDELVEKYFQEIIMAASAAEVAREGLQNPSYAESVLHQGKLQALITNLNDVVSKTNALFISLERDISEIKEDAKANHPDKLNPEEKSGARGVSTDTATEGVAQAYPINIYGLNVDIGKYADKPAFISAAPRIIDNVFNSAMGKAFIDPSGYYGGLLGKKETKELTFLNYLLFFYRNNIDTPAKLRRYVRQNYSKMQRGKDSAFKDALKKYRGSGDDFSSLASDFENNLKKVGGKDTSTINNQKNRMKFSEFSTNKNYFNNLIRNLDDEFMSSYYAGLKGMHSEKPKKRKPDYNKLYQVTDETGTDFLLSAHPKSTYIADALGDGGLFENGLEQQAKTEQVLLSLPTGNFINRYAKFSQNLIKIADDADKNGDFDLANKLDQILIELNNIT